MYGVKRHRGRFTEKQRVTSINFRELYTVLIAMRWYGPEWQGKCVLARVDNVTAVACINKVFSKSAALNKLARRIRLLQLKFGFVLRAEHVSGVCNTIPDALSRFTMRPTTNDWQFDHGEFLRIQEEVGKFEADMCCDPLGKNAHLAEYYSELNSALHQNVEGRRTWWNPPFELMLPVLQHILRAKKNHAGTQAAVVVPEYPGPPQPWWYLKKYFTTIRRFPSGSHLFTARAWSQQHPNEERQLRGPMRWPVRVLYLC